MKPRKPKKNGAPKLRSIQRAFARGILRPLTPRNRMQPHWTDKKSSRQAVSEFIKPNDRLNPFERLEIYNRQYWYRLIDSLDEDFPGLRALLGDRRFHQLAIAYLTKYPSDGYTLRNLGQRLGRFLDQEPKWIEPHRKLAREIARLEWAHIVAFDSEVLPPLEIDELLDGNPATLKLGFQPYLSFLACDYPVDDYIINVRRREEPQGEASNAVSEPAPRPEVKKLKRPAPEKIWLAVHRSENSVYYKRLDPEAYLICSLLQKGLTLQAACEKAFRRRKHDENFSATLQGWFAQWASFGWFCRSE